ncbi:MAG: universal stress protein [Alphaproteobacteria bacterium]|nr:universal stress protein [Alphaproteobacteria bacterium]
MPRLIAFIDSSIYANSVLDHAAWVGRRLSADIEVLHVLGRGDMSSNEVNLSGALDPDARDYLMAELSALDEQKAKLAQKRGRLILQDAKQRLEAAGIQVVTTKLRIGDLVETMHEFETGADLILIGKRGEAADFARMHLGSNIERVVRASTKPILVASREFKPIERVLIAFDGGASITKGINYLSKAQTAFSGLSLTLLKVGECTADAKDRVDHATAMLRAVGYQVESRVVPGEPERVISEAVEEEKFNLLVMGAYGHSRIRSLIVGSTTTAMIRSCKIPIVLFR